MKAIWFVIVSLILASGCAGVKVNNNVFFNSSYIYYSKVKAKITLPSGNKYSTKGNIFLSRDTLICFRFFGPLSYEVVNGKIDTECKVYDCINQQLYDNGFKLIEEKVGLVMNREVVEDLLMAKFNELRTVLLSLNKISISIDSSGKQKELVIDDTRGRHCEITASIAGLIPKKIVIRTGDNAGESVIELDFLLISNDKRKCNFNY